MLLRKRYGNIYFFIEKGDKNAQVETFDKRYKQC